MTHQRSSVPELESRDPDCISPTLAVELLSDAPWQSLVVVGDSVAAGVRQPLDGYLDECFADRLGSALAITRPGFRYRNLGVRDLKLQQIIDSQLVPAIAFRPDAALVIAGGNDALGRQFDADYVRDRLQALLGALAEAGADIITVGLFDLARSGLVPREMQRELTARFDELDRLTAEATAAAGGLHIDTHHHSRSADPAIYSDDHIHGNARGHAIAFAAIVSELAASGRWWPARMERQFPASAGA
jgi:lysophospholipase L1-like esterase